MHYYGWLHVNEGNDVLKPSIHFLWPLLLNSGRRVTQAASLSQGSLSNPWPSCCEMRVSTIFFFNCANLKKKQKLTYLWMHHYSTEALAQGEMSVRCFSAPASFTHYQLCAPLAGCQAGKSTSRPDAQAPLSPRPTESILLTFSNCRR